MNTLEMIEARLTTQPAAAPSQLDKAVVAVKQDMVNFAAAVRGLRVREEAFGIDVLAAAMDEETAEDYRGVMAVVGLVVNATGDTTPQYIAALRERVPVEVPPE